LKEPNLIESFARNKELGKEPRIRGDINEKILLFKAVNANFPTQNNGILAFFAVF
jgi:hypothetical protein